MNATPYIVAAYAVFFVVLAIDLATPLLGKRRTLERIRAQLRRARAKATRP
jgi:heme exporter protein CcmD